MKRLFACIPFLVTFFAISGCTTTEITALHISNPPGQNINMECVEYDDFSHASVGIKDNLERGWKPMVAGRRLTCFFWCADYIEVCYEKAK